MNAIEKFQFQWDRDSVRLIKPGCIIPLEAVFFKANRRTMRGLEEHLVNVIGDRDDHNFTFGTYFYELTEGSGEKLYVKFDPNWVTFGSSILV